jgi:hypothetical protein
MDNNNWPDPARPGVPLNPEKGGWHWLLANTNKGPQPDAACWDARLDRWFVQGCEDAFRPNQIMNRGWLGYLGPCLTPAEVEARVAQARRDALEDCAKWHDEVAAEYKKEQLLCEAQDSWTVAYVFAQGYVINNKRAAAIRALKGEGNE